MGDERIEEDNVGESRGQATMEAGVITPERSVRVDREYGGENLRDEENENGDIKRSAAECKFLFLDRLEQPSGSNGDGGEVDKEHFIELKNLGGLGPKN